MLIGIGLFLVAVAAFAARMSSNSSPGPVEVNVQPIGESRPAPVKKALTEEEVFRAMSDAFEAYI
jgi:hypothetical protein